MGAGPDARRRGPPALGQAGLAADQATRRARPAASRVRRRHRAAGQRAPGPAARARGGLAGIAGAAARHAGHRPAGRRAVDLRDQVRRLPDAGPLRRPRAPGALHPAGQRLEQQAAGAAARAGPARLALQLARWRAGRARPRWRSRLQRLAERVRSALHAPADLLRLRSAVPPGPRPARRAADRAASAAAESPSRPRERAPALQRRCRCRCRQRPGSRLPAPARRRDCQARRLALPVWAGHGLAQAQVPAAAGVRHRRLHRPGSPSGRGGQPAAGRARCRRPAGAGRPRRHGLGCRTGPAAVPTPRRPASRQLAFPPSLGRGRRPLAPRPGGAGPLGAPRAAGRGGLRRLDAGRPDPPCILHRPAQRQGGPHDHPRRAAEAGGDPFDPRRRQAPSHHPSGAGHRPEHRPDEARPCALLRERGRAHPAAPDDARWPRCAARRA
jgi:hypothetical protein